MLYLRVIAAIGWLVLSGALLIVWWLEEQLNGVGQAMLAFAVLYTLGSLVLKAADALDMAYRGWSSRIEGRC